MSAIQSALATVEKGISREDAESAFAASDRMIRLGIRVPAAFAARARALEMSAQHDAALDDLLEAAAASPSQSEFKLRALRFAFQHGLSRRAAHLAALWLRIDAHLIRHVEFTEALRHMEPPYGFCELHGDILAGWAIGSDSRKVIVEVDGGYAEAEAARPTPELAAMGLGDGRNGFSVKLPAWQRIVRVGIEGQSLWGSPFARSELPAGGPPAKRPLPSEPVDIIVPVYSGMQETLACIDSVLSSPCKLASRLIVVDDCSPDRPLVEALTRLEQQGKLTILRRRINAGFIGAVHTALDADRTSTRDIVLLNADTLVHGDWLDRLQLAAYSHRAVATVTPLSNNAELLSHPEPQQNGKMPDASTLAVLDDLASASRARPMTVPTGIGFCMYIRRDALRALGGFDEAFLKRGYAEENDFCLRAAESGWRNVVAPNVFVAHQGEVSFGTEKRWLAAHNVRRLKARHPAHDSEYDRFLAHDPLAPARRSMQRHSLRPLVRGRALSLVVTDVAEVAWRLGTAPEARLLITDTGAVLEFRQVAGLGRIDYVGKRGLAECERDLQTARFAEVVLQASCDEALRLARFAGHDTIRSTTHAIETAALHPFSAGLPPTRLLVPSPVRTGDFVGLSALAREWLAQGLAHRLIVLGTSFKDDHLGGLPNVHVAGPLEQREVDREGMSCLRKFIRQYAASAIALLPSSSARDWIAIAAETELPVYRLQLPSRAEKAAPAESFANAGIEPTGARYTGALLGIDGLCVSGWAQLQALPGIPVVIEILVDGFPIASVHADAWLPAVDGQASPAIPEGSGFTCFLRPEVMRSARSIRARVANTTHYLEGELRPERIIDMEGRSKRESLRAASHVRNHGGLRIHGVAVDAAQPHRTLAVHVDFKGRRIAEALANDWSADLHGVPGVSAAHGFSLTLPASFADGQQRVVRVMDETGRELPGSPLTVCCVDQPVTTWLQSLSVRPADRSVLENVLEMAQRHVPLSVDFTGYADWKRRFGSSPVKAAQGKVMIVVGFVTDADECLHSTLASLIRQTHTDWIACIKGRGESRDERIRFVSQGQWKYIIRAMLQSADYAAIIEPGDLWHPNTLAHALAALQQEEVQVAYCDCDDAEDSREPWFKPNWCPDVFLAQPLLHHGFVARASVLASVFEGDRPSDWPWLAAAAIGDNARSYSHIAYPHHTSTHLPTTPGKRARLMLQERFKVSIVNTRKPRPHALIHAHRIVYPDPDWPSVTLVVPTRDGFELLKACIESMLRADYPALDICVVDNGSACQKTLAYLRRLPEKGIRVLSWPYPFNYSTINNFAVSQTTSDVIGLINNDIEALDTTWLKSMVRQLMRDGVGAVGAKLLWKNSMVQHAGVQVGLHGLAGHVGNNWLDTDAGYCGINQIVRSTSAVTAACLLMRRADYERSGGLDERAFPVSFNDVDLCLRLRADGKRIVWTPEARLFHLESASRGADQIPEKRARLEREKARMHARWGETLFRDPYYNPNLNLDQYSHTALAFPPRHP